MERIQNRHVCNYCGGYDSILLSQYLYINQLLNSTIPTSQVRSYLWNRELLKLMRMAATNTKLLLADIASGIKNVPSKYVRPISDRPNLSDVHSSDVSIPLIDLHGLHGPDHSLIIQQIGQACQSDGFFQV